MTVAAASPAASPGRSGSLQKAWLVFGSLTLLLTLFLLVVAVLMLDRRRRRRRVRPDDADGPAIDAWSEAGRRAPAYGPETEDD